LAVHTGVNNEANKIVRTQANGYVDFGWINTISGDNGTTAINRIYASQDAYIRYYTPDNFGIAMASFQMRSNASATNTVDLRAPIYYDSNNTAFFGDFASTSNLNLLALGNGVETFPLLTMGANGRYALGVSGAYTRLSAHPSGNGVQLGSWDGTTFTSRLTVNNDGNVLATTSFRAPIFYDSDNTGYYTDPASISRMSGINIDNPIYEAFQSYSNSDNGPIKTWSGTLVAGGDNDTALAYTVIISNVPQDSYMMGSFTIDWFENYGSTNAKTSIQLGGYWNPESNSGFVGWEMTTSNPYIRPTIQVGRETSSGKTVFILTHFNSSYVQIVARDLFLGYSTGAENYGYGWTIRQDSSLGAYTSLDTVVLRSSPATDGNGATGTWPIGISGNSGTVTDGVYLSGTQTITGAKQFQTNTGPKLGSLDTSRLQAYSTGNNSAFMSFHKASVFAVNMGLDDDNVMRIGGWSAAANRWELDMNGHNLVAGSFRAPIFYDSDDTAYYMDYNSTTSGRLRGNLIFNDYGAGIVGTYDSVRYQAVFAMGDAYKLPINGTSVGSLYGIAWSHPNAGGAAGNLASHGMLILENGTFQGAWGGGSLRTPGDVRAPIFYDSNNTGYYVDPASTSLLNAVDLAGLLVSKTNTTTFVNANDSTISVRGNTSWGAVMSFHRAGAYAVNFGLDTDNIMKLGGWSASTVRHSWDMNGNYTATGDVTAYSDVKLKENIENIPDAINKVKQIRGVTFTRNDQEDKEKRHTGVIAQEVQEVLPEVITTDSEGIKAVAYGNMVGLLIEAIKEQQTQIDKLSILIDSRNLNT
jgi:hypothetical protein